MKELKILQQIFSGNGLTNKLKSIVVGLTGSPGCGKSTIGNIFNSFSDWKYLSADQICSEIYLEQNSSLLKTLESHWSKSIYTESGLLNKQFIAEKIFNNKSEKLWLESILHPLIYSRLQTQSYEAYQTTSC